MKRIICFVLALMLMLGCTNALAKSKKMDIALDPWNESNARQYVLDYIEGKSYERLYSWFDLQIRRYMPFETYTSLLADLNFLTGKFVRLTDSYMTFTDEKGTLQTHVFHMVMEKMDLEVYFSHKNEADDWDVMGLDFVPAEREELTDDLMLVGSDPFTPEAKYTEQAIQVGTTEYPLDGVLSIPVDASASAPVPVCILIHDDGPYDMHMTLGETAVFDDIADLFGDMGIAVLRYNKRTYQYPDCAVDTIEEEVIEDAVTAIRFAADCEQIDSKNIFLIGMGFGGTVAHRIALEAEAVPVEGIIIINGTLASKLEYDYTHQKGTLNGDTEEVKDLVRNLKSWKEDKVRSYNGTLFGHSAYYYWEMMQYKQENMIKKAKIETLIVQSRSDPFVNRDEGLNTYKSTLGKSARNTAFLEFRNLNHILMKDLSLNTANQPTYSYHMNLDIVAGQELANWVLNKLSK